MPKPSFIGFSPLSRLPARFGPSAFLIGSVRRLRLFPSCVLSFDLCRWSNCGSKAVLHTRRRLVYAAEVVGDYGTILTRLANGHDIHRGALLENPLAEPLPRESVWPGAAATIRRFEPNSVWVEVEAKEKALLVRARPRRRTS